MCINRRVVVCSKSIHMNLSSFVSKDRLLSRPSLWAMQFILAFCATCLSAALLFSERIMESLVTMIIAERDEEEREERKATAWALSLRERKHYFLP